MDGKAPSMASFGIANVADSNLPGDGQDDGCGGRNDGRVIRTTANGQLKGRLMAADGSKLKSIDLAQRTSELMYDSPM